MTYTLADQLNGIPIPPHSQHKEREPWCAKCNEIAAVIKRYEQAQNPALARLHDPSTSHEAAESVNTNEHEQTVLRTLREHPDSTILEVVKFSGGDMQTLSPRFAPLKRKGMIYATGKKQNPTGKQAMTWRVTE